MLVLVVGWLGALNRRRATRAHCARPWSPLSILPSCLLDTVPLQPTLHYYTSMAWSVARSAFLVARVHSWCMQVGFLVKVQGQQLTGRAREHRRRGSRVCIREASRFRECDKPWWAPLARFFRRLAPPQVAPQAYGFA